MSRTPDQVNNNSKAYCFQADQLCLAAIGLAFVATWRKMQRLLTADNTMNRCHLLIACLLSGLVPWSWGMAQSVDRLPRPTPGNMVIDQARVIQDFSKNQLEELCREIKNFRKSELVILTVQDTGNVDPEKYATNYFNRCEIGESQNNNGLLVFAAMQQRTASVIIGEGLDTPENRKLCRTIAEEVMVPRFKRNDPAGAMFGGGFAAARQILGYKDLANRIEGKTNREHRVRKKNSPDRKMFFIGLAGAGVLGIGGFSFFWSRYQIRYGKRDCKSCQTEMVMLDEQKDDTFLDPPERIEERIGSVDYDVWACLSCDEVTKYRYGKFFTRYSKCPRCRYKTRNKVTRTIRAATQNRGGKVRVTETCVNCDYHKTWTYSTPRLPKPSKKSRKSGGGGFRIGTSSSGSSRSSWGGGFGGGGSSSRGGSSRGGGSARW